MCQALFLRFFWGVEEEERMESGLWDKVCRRGNFGRNGSSGRREDRGRGDCFGYMCERCKQKTSGDCLTTDKRKNIPNTAFSTTNKLESALLCLCHRDRHHLDISFYFSFFPLLSPLILPL